MTLLFSFNTVLFLFLFVIWSNKSFLDISIKLSLFFGLFFNGAMLVHSLGFIVKV